MGIFTALSPITAASILLPTGLCRYSQSSKPKLYVVAILGANNAHAESSRQMVNNFTLLHAIISAHPSYVAKDSRWYTTPALQGLKEEETKPEDFPRASTTFETVVRSGSSLVRSKLPSILEKVTQKARQVDKILIVLVGPEFEEQPAMRVGEYLLRCSELEANLNAYPSEADVYCLLPTACRLSMMGCTPDHWSVLVGEGLNKESVSVDDASGFQSSKSREGESIAYNDLPSLCFWNNLGLDNRSCKNVSAVEPSFERCISGFHLLQLKWGPSRIITKPSSARIHSSRISPRTHQGVQTKRTPIPLLERRNLHSLHAISKGF
ncbi:hypothetical protein V5O48_001890 [Marasmius crinis-equi]|uniref:Uncharacterized protein n=1 Tax=Marasmius crinis-equi TaxID=585013 RepID=A0ABR3FXQ6_9AGAR